MKKNETDLPIERWTWEHIDYAIDAVLDKLQDIPQKSFLGVLAIPYGGIIPAVLISKRIGMKGKIKTLEQSALKEGHWLIVDEICDSGKTMKLVSKNFPNSIYMCLVTTPRARQIMGSDNFIYGEEATGKWIKFPWELEGEEK